MKRAGHRDAGPPSIFGSLGHWTWCVAVAVVLLTPLFVSPSGNDAFRLPKEILFRAGGILIVLLWSIRLIWRGDVFLEELRSRSSTLFLVGAIVVWTLITSLTSLNGRLSVLSAIWVVSAVLLFLVIEGGAVDRSPALLGIGFIPALLNAVLVILQGARIWNPFIPDELLFTPTGQRITAFHGTIGFLGNSNDVGTYLLPSFICGLAASLTIRKGRMIWIFLTVAVFGGLVVAQAFASYVALGAALVAFAFVSPTRVRVALLSTLGVLALAAVTVRSPIRDRIFAIREMIHTREFNEIVSGRLLGTMTAWEMFKAHPILGTGPGAYGFEFFPYALAERQRFPNLLRGDGVLQNFGEAHNDHLQVLATTGIPGYALMIAAMIALARTSFHDADSDDERVQFTRLGSFPLAVGFAVSALAQFPLELTAALTAYVFFAAVCIAWSRQRPERSSSSIASRQPLA